MLSRGKLTFEQLQLFSEKAMTAGKRLGPFLLDTGNVTGKDLAAAYAEQFRLQSYDLENFKIPPQFLEEIEIALMYRYPFVPVHEAEGLLTQNSLEFKDGI